MVAVSRPSFFRAPLPLFHVVLVGHHVHQIGHQSFMVANPAYDQLNREKYVFHSLFVPGKLVSQGRFSRPVPRACCLMISYDD